VLDIASSYHHVGMATTAGNYRRSDGLVRIHPPRELAAAAFELYETLRPAVPEGVKGWGAKGVLDLRTICSLAKG
jgi:hypothetical protein